MLERFINIFEGSNDFYGQAKRIDNRLSVKVEVEAWTKKEPVSKQLWKNHLEGVGPQLGIAPLRKDGTCKWGAIDIDKNNYDYKELLNKIREKNFPLIMFRSKSGRAHVYMFMKDFYSAEEVKLVMNKFAAKLGIADILDRVYPMQINLESNMFGSWLNMPYFNHEEGSTFAYTDDFEDADVETFFEMYDKYAQDNLTDFLVEEVKEVVKPKKAKEKTIEDFFLPCVKNCLKDNNGKVPSVNRNDFLLHKYVWSMRAVKAGLKNIEKFSTYNAKNLLKFFNKNYLQDPLEEKEIDNTILKSTDREYNYLCKRPDIKKYCDASACTRHVCGITPQEALDLVEATQGLGNITEYTSVPPIFYETVEVTQADKVKKFIRVEMTGDVLINKKLWINALTSMGNFPPIAIVKLKDAAFLDMQYERLEKRVKEKADEEASEEYEFKALVYDFIRKQTVSFLKEDLLENACYVDKKTSLLDFKLDNFMNYLKTQKINTPRRKITFKLKHFLQAEKINGTVFNKITNKKKSIPTWRFKSDPDKYEVLGDDAKPVIDYEKN